MRLKILSWPVGHFTRLLMVSKAVANNKGNNMNQTQPLTSYEAITLLRTIQPLAGLILERGPGYQFDENTQLFISRLIAQINQADFSTPALSHIHHSAGISDQAMKALWNWYSYRRARVETSPPDGELEMENWLQD
jgi:hypothetical protein